MLFTFIPIILIFVMLFVVALLNNANAQLEEGVELSYLDHTHKTSKIVGWSVGEARDAFTQFKEWDIHPDTECLLDEYPILPSEEYDYRLIDGNRLRFLSDSEMEEGVFDPDMERHRVYHQCDYSHDSHCNK